MPTPTRRLLNWPDGMTETFIPRGSSNVAQATYDEAGLILTIEFQDGSTYQYDAVPRDVWHGFQHSTSAGSYFHRQIKGRYTYRQV